MGAALATQPGSGQLNGVEQFSSTSATFLSRLAAVLPLGYAFGAGMVSAVNPCGFALLPTYLGLYLGSDEPPGKSSISRRLGRAALISLIVTGSFVVLFGIAGLAISMTTLALGTYFRWIGLAVGALLLVAGGAMLAGRQIYSSLAQRVGDRMGPAAQRGGVRGYVAYGFAYGACSLGCTIPIFLAVVASGLVARGPAGAFLQFVLYGLGMGFVLSVLTVIAAVIKHAAFRGVRRLGAYMEPASALLLLVTGGYVVYYWLSIGGVLQALGLGRPA